MKKVLLGWLCATLLFTATACTKEPAVTETPPLTDTVLTCDMGEYAWFSDFFAEQEESDWAEKGRYSLRVTGLCVPVTVEMDGSTVLSVSAFGHTAEVELAWYQDAVNAEIQGTDAVIVVRDCEEWDSRSWVFTAKTCRAFLPEQNVSTIVRVDEEGALRYIRATNDYNTSFNQWDTAPIDCCVSRDDFVYETGRVELVDGEPVLKPEESYTVSELYDLDALFADAKQNGMYAQYSTVDEVLNANRQHRETE